MRAAEMIHQNSFFTKITKDSKTNLSTAVRTMNDSIQKEKESLILENKSLPDQIHVNKSSIFSPKNQVTEKRLRHERNQSLNQTNLVLGDPSASPLYPMSFNLNKTSNASLIGISKLDQTPFDIGNSATLKKGQAFGVNLDQAFSSQFVYNHNQANAVTFA